MNDLVVNRAQCLSCWGIIVSKHRRDFVSCPCGNVSLDGGISCPRVIIKSSNTLKSLDLYQDSPWEEIRQYVYRGSHGKNGDEELTWIALCDMTDLHLEAVIDYKQVYGETKDIHYWCYKKEQEYRYNQKISVI